MFYYIEMGLRTSLKAVVVFSSTNCSAASEIFFRFRMRVRRGAGDMGEEEFICLTLQQDFGWCRHHNEVHEVPT